MEKDTTTMEDMIFQQGAEARVFLMEGRPGTPPILVKERLPKTYRHPSLDEKLTRRRVLQESRILAKLKSAGLPVPDLLMNPLLEQTTDEHKKRPKKGENKIYMEFVPGPSVAEFLRTKTSDNDTVEPQEDIDTVARQLGQILCSMHALNIAHGDLTTSNMLLRNGRPETLVLIDFGLSSVSSSAEDKAVDLYVLERAIASTHPHLSTRTPSWFQRILESYESHNPATAAPVLKRLEAVQARGRKRTAFG